MNFFQGLFSRDKRHLRKYDAATKSRRGAGWHGTEGDANSQIKGDLVTLRNRSRDLRRNNPYARRIVEVITNNVVGKGIITDADNETVNKDWKKWAYSTEIDWTGRHDIRGLQRIIQDAITESGEVLIRKRITSEDGLTIPLQYQILESDFLDSSMLKTASRASNYVIQGIEFTEDGKRFGYWIYETHPASDLSKGSLKSNFIPCEEIIHIFRQERPGQVRGVPWMAPSMMRLRDLDEYEDAQLMKQKVAACFTAFVHDIDGSVDCEDTGTVDEDGQKIQPGLIEQLAPGKTISFANPPVIENYKEFISSQLRAISSGVGLSYESFSGDISEVNFSSARMGWIEMGRNIDSWREDLIIRPFLGEAVRDFKKWMKVMGRNYQDAVFNHVSPRREMIDPGKELTALTKMVRAGFDSRSSVIQSLGRDPKEVMNQIEKDNVEADAKGLVLDSDPRKVNENGKAQVETVPGENNE